VLCGGGNKTKGAQLNNRRHLELAARERAALVEAIFYEIRQGLDLVGASEDVRTVVDEIQERFTDELNEPYSMPLSRHNKILREKYSKIAQALIRRTNGTILSFDINKYTARLAALGRRKLPEYYLGTYRKVDRKKYMNFVRKENRTRLAHKRN
jgi:hypothetical protein